MKPRNAIYSINFETCYLFTYKIYPGNELYVEFKHWSNKTTSIYVYSKQSMVLLLQVLQLNLIFRNVEMLKSDIVYFQTVFNESYEANEFFMQDIYNITLILAEEIAFRYELTTVLIHSWIHILILFFDTFVL